jgi:hypothetical protein
LTGANGCPAETFAMLMAGIEAGLCRPGFCDPEIIATLCRDWSACHQALADAFGEAAATSMDRGCTAALELVVGVIAAVAAIGGCCCCLGACLCWHCHVKRRGSSAEERAGLTITKGGASQPEDSAVASGRGNLPDAADDVEAIARIEALEGLKRLLDSGVLTEDEFGEKREQFLARL